MGEWKYSSIHKPQHGKEISDQLYAPVALFPVLCETSSMWHAFVNFCLEVACACQSLREVYMYLHEIRITSALKEKKYKLYEMVWTAT
jgi:hypothetical protein